MGKSAFYRAAPAFAHCLHPLHHRVNERFQRGFDTMPRRAELTPSPNELWTDWPSRVRTRSSGIANLAGFGCSGLPVTGARYMSSRAAAREDPSALLSAGMASSPPSRRARRRSLSSTASRKAKTRLRHRPSPRSPWPIWPRGYLEAHVAVNCNAHTAGKSTGVRSTTHILPALGAMPVGSVGRSEAAALHYSLRDTPRAANRALWWCCPRVFTLAEAWGLASARRQSLPVRAEVQVGQARAVPHAGRVSADRARAVCPGGRGHGAGTRRVRAAVDNC